MTLRLECEFKVFKNEGFDLLGPYRFAHNNGANGAAGNESFWIQLDDNLTTRKVEVYYGYERAGQGRLNFDTGLSINNQEWNRLALEADESEVRYFLNDILLASVNRSLLFYQPDLTWGRLRVLGHFTIASYVFIDNYKAFEDGKQTDGCDFEGASGGFNSVLDGFLGWQYGGAADVDDAGHNNVLRIDWFANSARNPFEPSRVDALVDRFGTHFTVTSPALRKTTSPLTTGSAVKVFRNEGPALGSQVGIISTGQVPCVATVRALPDAAVKVALAEYNYSNNLLQIMSATSRDDGETWQTALVGWTNIVWNLFPQIQIARDGTIVHVWADGNAVKMKRGSEAIATLFTLADPTARPSLSFRIDPDNVWRIFYVYGSDNGDLSTSGSKYSTDDGDSWSDG